MVPSHFELHSTYRPKKEVEKEKEEVLVVEVEYDMTEDVKFDVFINRLAITYQLKDLHAQHGESIAVTLAPRYHN